MPPTSQLPTDATAAAYITQGNVLAQARRFADALACYEQALQREPNSALAASNRGAMLHQLRRYDEALASYNQAIANDANYLDAYINRGTLLTDMQQFDEARVSLDAALARAPESAEAHWNMALLALVQGDFAHGWREFEWRWKKSPFKEHLRNYPQPLWLGDTPIAGKTLLLHPEQGFGDFVQCMRYVSVLEAMGAKLVIETPAPLVPLIATVSASAVVVKQGDALPAFDLHCPIMSLALALRTTVETIPATTPYLAVTEAARAKWLQLLGPGTKPRIGIVWSGAQSHVNDHNRSARLADFAPLLALPFEFFMLQKEARQEDVPYFDRLQIHAAQMENFGDTAALVEEMDLIICVDTAVAHVAGALGKPVWLLLPYAPDFRWLVGREDSPWYPSARLFRQRVPGDWAEAIGRVKNSLAELAAPDAQTAATLRDAFAQALAAHQGGDLETARQLYETILQIDPQHLNSLSNLSSLYLQKNMLEPALMLIERALAIDESQAALHYNYGRILMQAKMPEEAVRRYSRAIELAPDMAVFYSNRGVALFELNRYIDAVADYGEAIARDAAPAEYYNNRANALAHLMRIDEAIADYARAIERHPDMGDAHFNWALLELMKGEFAEGWKRHEKRWLKPSFAIDRRQLPKPLWLGQEPIAGKTIFLYPEQGLGDVVQFSRYVPLLEAMGATVILQVHAMLFELMKTLSPTATVIAKNTEPPPYDVQCPIMSLPLAMGTTLDTIPANVPYLHTTLEKRTKWQQRLGPKTRMRVGIAWSGSKTHQNDHNRSMQLAMLAPLFALPIEFHSLQLEVREADQPYLHHLKTHAEEIGDFTDTAALIEQMDVVLSVDTSVAHVAGALGKPLWMMVTAIPDFRWLLEREDSPWYPTARLFRQQAQGQWDEVIGRVKKALAEMASR